jgi:hypothetical protein
MSLQMAWMAFPNSSIALLTALTSLLVSAVSSAKRRSRRSMASMITQRARSPVPVCDLVFLSRYMRPEGPWQRLRRCLEQRRWLFLYTCIPCARTGLTGHNGPPTPPTVKKSLLLFSTTIAPPNLLPSSHSRFLADPSLLSTRAASFRREVRADSLSRISSGPRPPWGLA